MKVDCPCGETVRGESEDELAAFLIGAARSGIRRAR